MGICLSCLGLSRKPSNDDAERSHLLGSDDPYNTYGDGYGSTSQGLAPRHVLNPEEAKREQEALERITRCTTDAVVDIFPHHTLLANSSNLASSQIHDQLPGDKSSRIRRYSTSRPVSQASGESSIRSKASSQKPFLGGRATQPRIFRTLEVGTGD